MTDPDICIHCSATGCVTDTAVHDRTCPMVTKLFPVREIDVSMGMHCPCCQERFELGEFYTVRDLNEAQHMEFMAGHEATKLFDFTKIEGSRVIMCLPCSALDKEIP